MSVSIDKKQHLGHIIVKQRRKDRDCRAKWRMETRICISKLSKVHRWADRIGCRGTPKRADH